MVRLRPALALAVALAAAAAPAARAQDPVGDALRAAHAQMEAGEWQAAYDGLQALLRDNEGSYEVLALLPEIKEDLVRCLCWKDRGAPGPADAFSAEVLSFDEKKGVLHLKWSGGELGDLEVEDELIEFPAGIALPDLLVIKNVAYNDGGIPRVTFGDEAGVSYVIEPGLKRPGAGSMAANLRSREDGRWAAMDRNDKATFEDGEPYTLAVEIRRGTATIKANRKKLLKGKFDPLPDARLRLSNLGAHDTLELEWKGKVDPAFLRMQLAGARDRVESGFRGSVDFRAELPEWIHPLDPALDPAPPDPAVPGIPGKPGRYGHNLDLVRENLDDARKFHRYNQYLDWFAGLPADSLPPAAREWFFLLGTWEWGNYEYALGHARLVLKEQPHHAATVLMMGDAALKMGDSSTGNEAVTAAVTAEPRRGPLLYAWTRALMADGLRAEAEAFLGGFEENLQLAASLAQARRLIARADGPGWNSDSSHVGRMVEVATPAQPELAMRYARELDDALGNVARWLPATKLDRPLPVWVFADRLAARQFAGALLPPDALAVWCPEWGVVLAWQSPAQGDLLRSMREAAIHGYLETTLGAAPVTLRLGLPELLDDDEFRQGEGADPARRAENRSRIADDRLWSIPRTLNRRDPAALLAEDAAIVRAECWMLMRTLLRDKGAAKGILRDYVAALKSGGTVSAAYAKVADRVEDDLLRNEIWEDMEGRR